MNRRWRARPWVVVLTGLAAAALVVCVVATVAASWHAPVFVWPVPEGTVLVETKEQYESSLAVQQLGRVAAILTVAFGVGALALALVSRRRSTGEASPGRP